jgi:hypothetical protein
LREGESTQELKEGHGLGNEKAERNREFGDLMI